MKQITPFSHRLQSTYMTPLLVIGVVVLLAGCSLGGSGTTNPGPTAPGTTAVTPTTPARATTPPVTTSGACTLVTTAQASAVLGGSVQAHDLGIVRDGPVTEHACVYVVPPNGAAATLGVYVAPNSTTAQTAFAELRQQQKAAHPTRFQDISGLGDAAFTNGSLLYAIKGSTILGVGVQGVPSPSILPDEQQFAQDALPNVS